MEGNWLFKRLPPWIMDTLTNDQKAAIHDPSWKRYMVNIQVNLPLFKQRFFITVIGREEKRAVGRRATERRTYPLRTIANVSFVIGSATIFYAVALITQAFHAPIFEF